MPAGTVPGLVPLNWSHLLSDVIAFCCAARALEVGLGLGDLRRHGVGAWPCPARAMPSSSGVSSTRENRWTSRLAKRRDDLGRHLLGGNDLPRIDLAVASLVDAPSAAGRVEPAELVGLAGEFRVDVAVDLHAVLVVAPLVDDVVAVGIDELPQDDALRAFDDPAHVAVDLAGGDLALADLLGLGPIIVDPFLGRAEFQCLVRRRGCGP